jgi:hypothetical protein
LNKKILPYFFFQHPFAVILLVPERKKDFVKNRLHKFTSLQKLKKPSKRGKICHLQTILKKSDMQQSKNNFEPQSKQKQVITWDKINSSFYWKIYLDRSNPKNSPNVEFLQGYTKVEKQRESQDTCHMLKSKIFNLYKNGYFERIERIEIYQTQENIKIIILRTDGYDINPNHLDTVFKNYGLFLEDLYNRRKLNLSMDGLIKAKRQAISEDDRLNVNKVKIYSLSALYSYAGRLLIHGHPEGAVNNFILKYKESKQW